MQSSNQLKRGRYIVYIDLLGFREKLKEKGPEEIFELINDILEDFNRWENLNGAFKTIHFSDSFIFYQNHKGYRDWAFLDAYAIASFLFSAILAKGIAARGTITFGEFYVGLDRSKKHQIYFGSGLIEAYETEKRDNWIGITIQPSAWQPYEDHNVGAENDRTSAFLRELFSPYVQREPRILTMSITSAELTKYAASATLARRIEAEDTIVVNLRYRSGALGSINVTTLTYPKNLEGSITILGEKGTVKIGGIALNRIDTWEFDQPHPMGEEVEQANTNPTSVYGFGHLDFYSHVIEALKGNTNGIVEGREGRKTVEIIQAAYQSALSGGQVKPCAMPR